VATVGFNFSDVASAGDTTTVTVDVGANDFNAAIQNVPGSSTLRYSFENATGTIEVDLQSLNITDGATIEIVGADVDIILSRPDLIRYDNSDFTIVGINPVWTIENDVPSAPLFWMKGGDPQLSGSGNSLVISSNATALYTPTATFSQFGSNSMPAYNAGTGTLDFTGDGMQLSVKNMAYAFILFESIDAFGDILFGGSSGTSPATRFNNTGLSFTPSDGPNIGVSPTNDTDNRLEWGVTYGSVPEGSPINYPGGTLSTSTPYLVVCSFDSAAATAYDLLGIRGNNTDPSNFKIREILIFPDGTVLSEAQVSLIQQDMAWRSVAAGVGTLDQLLGSDHEHYSSQPVSAGAGAGTINSVSAPVTTVTFEAAPLLDGAEISIRWSNTNNQILRHRVVGSSYDWVPDTVPQRVDIDVNLAGYQPWRVRDRLITESVTLFVELRESTAWEAET
jgi:copper chaperone CopZ